MSELLKQLKWQFVILTRNNLIAISIAVTLLYGAIFYFIRDLGNTDKVLTLLIYNDPALIGLMFLGLSVIMEKNQSVLPALFVTPGSHHIYLISRILSLSIVGWACALGMGVFGLHFTFNPLHFSISVFATCIIFSIAGLFIVSFTTEFLQFLLRSIPVLFLLSVPLFNYFNLTDISAFHFTPLQGPLDLLVYSYQDGASMSELLVAYLSIAFWIPLLYFLTFRLFKSKVIQSI